MSIALWGSTYTAGHKPLKYPDDEFGERGVMIVRMISSKN